MSPINVRASFADIHIAPMTLHTKERPMLFLPYCNDFFIQMEVCRSDSARTKQTIKGVRTGRALSSGESYADAQAQLNPSPAASRAPAT